MDSFDHGSSHIPARSSKSRGLPRGAAGAATEFRSTEILGAPDRLIAFQGATKLRRLVADRQYFGLEAQAFRAGAERALARLSARPPGQARIDVNTVGEDFHLDSAASRALLRELLMGGLLHPDGNGGYLPTRHFHQYALSCVVAPLSRARAKSLIDRACALVAGINADSVRNPFCVRTMAVSGNYMSRHDQLSELSLWLILHTRRDAPSRRAAPPLAKDDALREIVQPISSLSSFVVARIVADTQAVPRPFSVVFQESDVVVDSSTPPWERFRDWGALITRRLVSK